MTHVVVMLLENADVPPGIVQAASRECRLRAAELHVVCLVPFEVEAGRAPENLHDAFARLEQALRPMAAGCGIALCMHVTGRGTPGAIADSVRRLGAELLIVPHRSHLGPEGGAAEPLARRLLDVPPCSILISA